MNEQPLDEMIRRAVDKARSDGNPSGDQLLTAVLSDPDVSLLMKGVEAHDRSGDLEGVYVRDIRRKIEKYLSEF